MLNYILKLNKIDIKYILILFFYWLSINTGSKYLNFNEISEINFEYCFNLIRSILPYIIFIYFISKFKLYITKIFKKDLFYICFFSYGVIQVIGLFFSMNYFYEHYWVVCLFSILIFFQNIQENRNLNLANLIFLVNIFMILIIFSIFTSIVLMENISSYSLLYHDKSFHYQIAGEYFPRSSGISRMAIILFFFFNALYFSNVFKKIPNLLIISTNSLLIFIIFLLQSRTVILFFLISYLIINLIFKFKFKQRIIYFLFTIIIPLMLFFSYPIFKHNLIKKFEIKQETFSNIVRHPNVSKYEILNSDHENFNKNFSVRNDFFIKPKNKNDEIRTLYENISSISNNRFNAWNYLIQVFIHGKLNEQMKDKVFKQGFEIKEKYTDGHARFMFGLGPQADRYLMELKKKNEGLAKSVTGPFGAHASNVFIYSLICGGFLSLLIFIILNLFMLFKIFKIIKYHKEIDLFRNHILISSIFIILFLMFRGLLENSYGVFGVDLILMISSYTVLSKNLSKINV